MRATDFAERTDLNRAHSPAIIAVARADSRDNHARVIKVHLVASEPTVEVIMMYMNELAPAFVELTTRRRQIRAAPIKSAQDNGQSCEGNGAGSMATPNEGQAELLRRAISITIQSAKSLATSLLALRDAMGEPLDKDRYEQLWQIQIGKMEPVWKQDIENLGPPPSSQLLDLVNRIFP